VEKTDMILSLPERIANAFVDLAPLNILPLPIELPAYDLVMVWHPLHDPDPAHRWLRDQIAEVSRNLRV
jgi:DNA-binding transcriptional LysR family regulator